MDNGCNCSSTRECEIEILLCFLPQNQISGIFELRQKPLNNWISEKEKQALPIQVLC